MEQKWTAKGFTARSRSHSFSTVTSRREAVTPRFSAANPRIQTSSDAFSRSHQSHANRNIRHPPSIVGRGTGRPRSLKGTISSRSTSSHTTPGLSISLDCYFERLPPELYKRPHNLRIQRSHLVRGVCIVLCCCFLAAAFDIALIPPGSMERTVMVGDHILVFKLFDAPDMLGTGMRLPRLRTPRRETLVSFRAPGAAKMIYLKRVVGIAGDTVEMRDGV